ncbi:cyclopropane-fatty-acyl-phospholipid synthase [Nitrospira sp. MA-1]|nr:cyclopropane-fatty-acyl-phospholipid synthase [Nitrospira sp. MA-1]
MASTTGMRGGGFYDAHSSGQRAAMDEFLPWMVEAMADLPLPARGSPIALLDLGSSEGANAIHAVGAIIKALRERTSADIWTFFDDLPTNDFNQLFANLFPDQTPSSRTAGIYTAAVGGSLFERVAPASSLDIATTFNAVGWMSALPTTPLRQFISPSPPAQRAFREGVSVTTEERAAFTQHAREDILSFYRSRAAELKPGGKLLVQVFGRNDEHNTANGIIDGLSDAMLDMVEDGRLTRDVYENFVFPVFYRSLPELLPPAGESGEPPAFRVDKAEARECRVPFNEEFARSGDSRVWAGSYAGFIRAFSEPVFTSGLPNTPDRPQLIDELYARMANRFEADPARYEFHFISLGALLTRV